MIVYEFDLMDFWSQFGFPTLRVVQEAIGGVNVKLC